MDNVHPQLNTVMDISEGMVDLVQVLVRAAARHIPRAPRRRNATLRPGPGTPMWNALVLSVRPHLRRRGEKINLGRELGLPPQRIHEYFVARRAAPDAERTLQIMRWLAARQPARRKSSARAT